MTHDEHDTFPVFAGRILIRGNKMTCIAGTEQFVVHAPARLLERLFVLCDGCRSLSALVDVLAKEWRRADVAGFVSGLLKSEVLVDAHNLPVTVWPRFQDSAVASSETDIAALTRSENARKLNDACDFVLPPAAGLLSKSLLRRCSAAAFSGEPISLAAISAMLWSAYGVQVRESEDGLYHRTVPSAGAFYPLDVCLLLLRPCETLAAGAYRAVYATDGSVGLQSIATRPERVPRAFVDPAVIEGAHAVIVFSADADASARKYGARAALYATLEAGHAVQNLLLAAQENAVATRELGGVFPREMANLLALPSGTEVLTSVACGISAKPAESALSQATVFQWLDNAAIDSAETLLCKATQTVAGKPVIGWGYSSNADTAYAKAVSEVAERRACMEAQGLECGEFGDMTAAVDPRTVVAYQPSQYRQESFPYSTFDTAGVYAWKQGVDADDGGVRHVLADHVYFPEALPAGHHPSYTAASSSGVAAHTTLAAAFENALLECVERDAFMCHWLNRIAPPRILVDSLPGEYVRRISDLTAQGTELAVLDISLDTVPVLLVAARNYEQGFFTLGASASFNPLYALSHAFEEVVFRLADFQRSGKAVPVIAPREVKTPVQHGLLYRQKRHFRRADFLLDSIDTKTFASIVPRLHQGQLVNALCVSGMRPILIDLTDERSSKKLHVARAVVPGLVPMSFGYGTEPQACSRLASIRRHCESLTIVKSVSRRSPFPHPFA